MAHQCSDVTLTQTGSTVKCQQMSDSINTQLPFHRFLNKTASHSAMHHRPHRYTWCSTEFWETLCLKELVHVTRSTAHSTYSFLLSATIGTIVNSQTTAQPTREALLNEESFIAATPRRHSHGPKQPAPPPGDDTHPSVSRTQDGSSHNFSGVR